jgi:CO/xanthine dehydrogenase FAD-binding subunit
VDVEIPRRLDDALAYLASRPDAEPICGGTDLMVEMNFGRHRPAAVMAIDRIDELKELLVVHGGVRMSAGVTYARMLREEIGSVAMRQAARTVGSPQIRNAGTIGGNLGTCSPAGDTLPVLAALDAAVVLRSASSHRRVPFTEYMTGPKRSIRRRDELVVAVEWSDAGEAQVFMKAGTRNAMVIAIASLALVVDPRRSRVGIALGSSGPTIIRATEAERFAEGLMDEAGWGRRRVPSDAGLAELGTRVAAAARPIDDVRGTVAYRRHVLGVMAQRAFARAVLAA